MQIPPSSKPAAWHSPLSLIVRDAGTIGVSATFDDQTPNGFGKLIVSRSVFSVAHPTLSLFRGALRALAPCGQGSFSLGKLSRWSDFRSGTNITPRKESRVVPFIHASRRDTCVSIIPEFIDPVWPREKSVPSRGFSFGSRVLHCTVMPKTRWGRVTCNTFTAWRFSTCPKLEASVQLAASPGLLLCRVD